jgi:hypothetical protein
VRKIKNLKAKDQIWGVVLLGLEKTIVKEKEMKIKKKLKRNKRKRERRMNLRSIVKFS